MKSVSIDLPENVFSDLHKQPNEFVREMRIAAAVKWYELGEISQLKAAEIAGLSSSEFMDALSRYQVAAGKYMPEEIAEKLDSDSTVVFSENKPSLREIAALPIAERHKLLVPFIAATAEDFLTDPELTEFSGL